MSGGTRTGAGRTWCQCAGPSTPSGGESWPKATTLSGTGYGDVTTVIGDGALGYPPGAPCDRLIATAACQWVPYAWVSQTRPGGRIVTPWGMPYYNFGLLALTVNDNGTATGQIVDSVAFMWLRDQRIAAQSARLPSRTSKPALPTPP